MAKKAVHHMDLDTLIEVNREVVALTNERSEVAPADRKKLVEALAEVESRADNVSFVEAVPEKASLLVFKLASGQYFRAGNKRTALVSGLVFLRKNGYKLDLDDSELVSTVDKVGVASATLEDLFSAMEGATKKAAMERRGWDRAVKEAIASNKKSLTDMGA